METYLLYKHVQKRFMLYKHIQTSARRACAPSCTHAPMDVCMHACSLARSPTYMHACVHACTHICMHITHIQACVWVYTYATYSDMCQAYATSCLKAFVQSVRSMSHFTTISRTSDSPRPPQTLSKSYSTTRTGTNSSDTRA